MLKPLAFSVWIALGVDFGHIVVKLEILVERDIEDSHPLLELVRQYKDTSSIGRIPEERVQTYGYNFLVIDDRGFRFERDRQQPNAYVAFRDQVSGSEEDRERAGIINRLKEIFEDLRQASTPPTIVNSLSIGL